MSCIKKDQIWQNLIGEPNMYVVEKINDEGWVNGKMVKPDADGMPVPVKTTGFAAFHETMKLTMKKVQLDEEGCLPQKKVETDG